MFNLHTHNKANIHNSNVIVNCALDDDLSLYPCFSLGIHPWDVDSDWKEKCRYLKKYLEKIENDGLLPNLYAIGEVGLDKVRGVAMPYQLECLDELLGLAEYYSKPVILHCVKAIDELLDVIKRRKFIQPVVFHGFRGKPELAAQLMDKGLYLSFGPKFNHESLKKAYERKRMFLETDDSGIDIKHIYESAGKVLNISPTDISVPGIFKS